MTTREDVRHIRDDAWLHAPTLQMLQRVAAQEKCSLEEAFRETDKRRARALDRILSDPHRYGLEPSIWWVVDALEDFPYCTADVEAIIKARTGLSWQEFKTAMRKTLGFVEPVVSTLVSGANRSGKSERAAKRAIMVAVNEGSSFVMALHATFAKSKKEQQPLYWKYLPRELKRQVASEVEYIKFKEGTGFSDNRIVLGNHTRLDFVAYSQNVQEVLEGAKVRWANADEEFPVEWLLALERRAAQLNGTVECTFTPIHGWTAGVGEFVEGMRPVMEMPAFVMPRDGRAPLPWLAMGLTREEYDELENAAREKRLARAPGSRPQDCLAWLTGGSGMPEIPAGRMFDVVPRVAKCRNPERAVVWFHPCDNPYGNPRAVIAKATHQGVDMVKQSVYGLASKRWSARFPTYSDEQHVISEGDIPAQGRNYLMMDPAGRNFFMLWIRSTPQCDYAYREWPSGYHIPGIGVPDPWAVASSRNPTRGNDGDRGGGQTSWGFSLLRYKYEIARLEQWGDWRKWAAAGAGPDEIPDFGELETWNEENGAGEVIECRYVDARPATAPKTEADRVTTLHTDLNNLGMWWSLAPADMIMDGVVKITSAIDYGKLKVATGCRNLRWALANWTGADGEKGACKDPIDCLRWFYGADLQCGALLPATNRVAKPVGGDMRMAAGGRQVAGPARVRWRAR